VTGRLLLPTSAQSSVQLHVILQLRIPRLSKCQLRRKVLLLSYEDLEKACGPAEKSYVGKMSRLTVGVCLLGYFYSKLSGLAVPDQSVGNISERLQYSPLVS
jgi:hypothetical protein